MDEPNWTKKKITYPTKTFYHKPGIQTKNLTDWI